MLDHPADHDIIIRLDTKVDFLTEKVSVLTDDHEKRLRTIERWVWKAIGAIAVINTLLGFYIIYKHQ